jgi:LruC domain-containing protein
MKKTQLTLLALSALISSSAIAAPGDSLQVATQKGANYLIVDVYNFDAANGCQACHRQGAAIYGLSVALAQGYAINTNDTNGLGRLATRAVADQSSPGYWTHGGSFTRSKTSYAVMGLAGYDKYVNTRYSGDLIEAANWLLSAQTISGTQGYWTEDHGSYPTTYGHVPVTARNILGLVQAQQRVDSNTAANYGAAITRATNWIRANRANTNGAIMYYNYQLAYALLGLKAAGAANDDPDVIYLRDALYARMSPGNVAWGDIANDTADEFNTGLTVYAMCLAGQRLDNPNLSSAANWLNGRQVNTTVNGQAAGYWPASGFATVDIPTTFATLGLGCFGTLGVQATVVGPTRQVVSSNSASAQTRTFTVRVDNTGAFGASDSYSVGINGGLPGWSASVSPQTLTVPSGGSQNVTVTITTGTNLPPALPVDFSVRVTSQSSSSVTSAVTVTVYTDPPPPVTGLNTTVTLTSGNGMTVTNRLQPYTLSAQVRDQNGVLVTGPSSGVVTFYVGGIPVTSDNDPDGNGTFSTQWTPGVNWNTTGTVDFRAIYSGIDYPGATPDLLPSFKAGTINLNLAADTDSDGIPDDIESGIVGTNPNVADTDGDGCTDGTEYYVLTTNPLLGDTDGDGTGDCSESQAGTDPLRDDSFPDADGDGVSDGADPFPCDGTASAVLFVPSETEYGQVMFEDNWPERGDLDFNDQVLAYNYQLFYESGGKVSRIVLTLEPMALGAEYKNGLSLRLPTSITAISSVTRNVVGVGQQSLSVDPRETNMVIRISDDAREFFGNQAGFLNTVNGGTLVDGAQVTVDIRFQTPVSLNLALEPFDLFFHRTQDETHQIHRPMYGGTAIMNQSLFGTGLDGSSATRFYVDNTGLPFVLSLPNLVAWPSEYTQIHQLYPDISVFAASGGALATDFFLSTVNNGAAYQPSIGLTTADPQVGALPVVSYDRTCTAIGLGN